MLSIKKGRDFTGPQSLMCPEKREFLAYRRKKVVSITTDEVVNEKRKSRRSDDVTETPRRNQLAFIRLKGSTIEHVNEAGQLISHRHIRLDEEFRPDGAIEQAAQRIADEVHEWNQRENPRRAVKMSAYRDSYRQWEYNLLTREWRAGNRSIFDPKCTDKDIEDAHEILLNQRNKEAAGEYKTEFRALEKRRIIPKPRASTTTHPANYPEATEEDITEVMEFPEQSASTSTPVKGGTRKRKIAGTSGSRKSQRTEKNLQDKVEKEKQKAIKTFERNEKIYKEKRNKQLAGELKIAQTIKARQQYLVDDIRSRWRHGLSSVLSESDITEEYAKSQLTKGELHRMKYKGKVPPRSINPTTGEYARRTKSPTLSPLPASKIPEDCIPDPPEGTPPLEERETTVFVAGETSDGVNVRQDINDRYFYYNHDHRKVLLPDQNNAKTMDIKTQALLFSRSNTRDR